MPIFHSLLQNITMFVLLMIPGFLMGKRGRITDHGTETMTNLLTDIAMPLIVFNKLLRIDLGSISITSVFCCLLVPAVSVVTVLLLSAAVFPKREDRRRRYPVERFCSMMPNCGFIGIPLAAAIFPDRPIVTLYVSVVNILCTYILLTLGTYVMSEDRREIQLKKLLFHPVIAAVLLGLACSKLPSPIVDFTESYSTFLANLATPVSMLVLGYRLAKLPLVGVFKNARLYMVLGMKLIVMPLVSMGVMLLLRLTVPMDEALVMALFLSTAVSTASSAPALAQRFSLNAEYAAALTIGTTVASIAVMPGMYLLLNLLF